MSLIDLKALPPKLGELHATQAGYLCDVHGCIVIGYHPQADVRQYGTSVALPSAGRRLWSLTTCGQMPRLTAYEIGDPITFRADERQIPIEILGVKPFATHNGKPVCEVTLTSNAQAKLPMHPEDAAVSGHQLG